MSLGTRNTVEEQELREKLREVRNALKRQIKEFTDEDLRTDNLTGAIAHQWSVVGRLEAEFDAVPPDDELMETLLATAETQYDKFTKQEFTTIPSREYQALLNRVARLEAKCSRASILGELRKANRTLGQQQGEAAKIEEIKARTEYIKIESHAAVLSAMKDIFYLALRKLGYTDEDLKRLAKELKRIEKDYPIIQEDYARIKGRLFGEPETVHLTLQEAEYELIERDTNGMERINELIGHGKRKGRKVNAEG